MVFNHRSNHQNPLQIRISEGTETHGPMIFEDMEVLATFTIQSFPSSSTFSVSRSLMYLQASLETRKL